MKPDKLRKNRSLNSIIFFGAAVLWILGDGIAFLYGFTHSFEETPFFIQWIRAFLRGIDTVAVQFLFYYNAKRRKSDELDKNREEKDLVQVQGQQGRIKCSKGAMILLGISVVLQVILGPLLVDIQSFSVWGILFAVWAVLAAATYYLGIREGRETGR